MESAAKLLLKHYRQVLVRAAYDNYVRIRFRADKLEKCYFNKVPSQRTRWQENGGALITWRNDNLEGPHDAIMFVECPKSLEALVPALASTRMVGVIYEPPTWRQHEQQLAKRFEGRPQKFTKHLKRLRVMQEFVGRLPELTRPRLARLISRQEPSLSSFVPERSEAGALPSDIAG